MKLLLTSAGLANDSITQAFLKLLEKDPETCTALIIAYGQTEEENFYINKAKEEVERLGFMTIVLNMNDCPGISTLPDFDVVYVCSGNTFAILKKMCELGLPEYIKKQVESGAVYVGVSAGSIIAGPDIKIAGWGVDADINEIGLVDLIGLGLTNVSVYVHYEAERHSKEVEDFKRTVEYPIQAITNDQAVFVDGETIIYI